MEMKFETSRIRVSAYKIRQLSQKLSGITAISDLGMASGAFADEVKELSLQLRDTSLSLKALFEKTAELLIAAADQMEETDKAIGTRM